ncbi:CapA family protein [Vibrio fluvialis]|nr:CapA family protein [Vibrio fluvialis]
MIVCGDFCFPFDKFDPSIVCASDEFMSKPKIVNFETTLDSLNVSKETKGIALSSHDSAFAFLKHFNVVGATLSNNHIKDFSYNLSDLLKKFECKTIKYTGLGNTLKSASKPMIIDDNVIINFGWEVIGCKKVDGKNFGCNPLIISHVIEVVKCALKEYSTKNIVVIFHWNYEFEQYPQPLHRKLAHELIDLGVNAIIGHHSHIIQGAEIYNGKPIIYGLGNFYLPKYTYNGYFLDFPESADIGLAVDINTLDGYLVDTKNNRIKVESIGNIFESDLISSLSSFSGMDDEQYLKFFIKNRVKRKFLPIYNSSGVFELVNNKFVMYRQIIIDTLVRLNIKTHSK